MRIFAVVGFMSLAWLWTGCTGSVEAPNDSSDEQLATEEPPGNQDGNTLEPGGEDGGEGSEQEGTSPDPDCSAQICTELGAECGTAADPCVGAVDCGPCSGCEIDCVANHCQPTPHAAKTCSLGQLYWQDSCGTIENQAATCDNGCQDGQCLCLHASCDGSCCQAGQVCNGSSCCTPDCTGKVCGSDQCGQSCPPGCNGLQRCQEGACVSLYPDKRVGIFYLAWHAYATDTYGRANPQLGIEDVIDDPARSFGDMLDIQGLNWEAWGFHYHVRPQNGPYCIYRARPGEPLYAERDFAPDCANISPTCERHARQLWDAGVDFVYMDATNLAFMSPVADVLSLRPIEVLFEEWQALRDRGNMTPQIAVWLPVEAKQSGQESWQYLYERILPLYNNPAYQNLVLRDLPSGKKVMFIVDNIWHEPDPVNEAIIAQNGGRNDILPVRLWTLLSDAEAASGIGAFMQPCEDSSGAYTTVIRADRPCNQSYTTTSLIGSILSASTSYQVGYASLPFQASGKINGLTFKKQFETAFLIHPNYLMINSFNELIAQPQDNPYLANLGDLAKSMGKQADNSIAGGWLWVDPYGAEFGRDIEPTLEWGDAYYELMKSCIRVYKQGVTQCNADTATEACCQIQQELILIYSLRINDPGNALNTHHVLTAAENERDTLLNSGAWEQVCNPIYAPQGLCAKSQNLTAEGPFQLFASPADRRAPLYRCYTGTSNFFSLDANCEGLQFVGLLGYLSQDRNSHTPRPLRRCYHTATSTHFHWLDEHCPTMANVNEEGLLGFVR